MAIGFKLIADPSNTEYRVMTIASQSYTVGDLVAVSRSAATVIPATSATITNNVFGVAMETVTSSATTLLCCIARPQQRFSADVTNATNTAHNLQRMVLTDARTVNNTGTDDTTTAAIVTQLGVVDATGKRILCSLNPESGVSA
jgi:hypothetical protein